MSGMSMPGVTWYRAAAGYLGMWMAMMVPMMLPSLIPALARYRQSLRGAGAIDRHRQTAVAGLGYFGVWAALGLAAYGAGVGLHAFEAAKWPGAAGMLVLLAGAVQFTSWKARQLVRCREGTRCCCPPVSTTLAALRHGVQLGIRCSLCCGSLMLALLAIGMANPVATLLVTLAVSAERLASAPVRMARAAGVVILPVGVVMIHR